MEFVKKQKELGLERFVKAQKDTYERAFDEVKNGEKLSHWIWFIFPQLKGLGRSPNSVYYGIENLKEAESFLKHPILGRRLRDITQVLLDLKNLSAIDIFGAVDAMKVRSCMTLFNECTDEKIFSDVLDKYYQGKKDEATMRILRESIEI